MFESIKYGHAVEFSLSQAQERLAKDGNVISDENYEFVKNSLLDRETLRHAIAIIKPLRAQYGKEPAPYLAAAYELALHYWSFQPYGLFPNPKEHLPLFADCALQFAVAQSGVEQGIDNCRKHAEGILGSAKDQFDAETRETE